MPCQLRLINVNDRVHVYTLSLLLLLMNTKNSLRWALVLMIASQLLLLAFVCYWLNSQYSDEKKALQKELLADLSETQRVITDSVLFERYIGPRFSTAKDDSNSISKLFKNGKVLPRNSEVTFYSSDTNPLVIDSLTKSISKRLDSMDTALGTKIIISATDTNLIEKHLVLKGKMKKAESYNTETNTVVISGDGNATYMPDSNILNAIAGLLRSALKESLKDSLGQMSLKVEPADIALVHKEFTKGLALRGKTLKATLISDSTINKADVKNKLMVSYNIYQHKGNVAVTGYRGYLLQKILPQLLFGVLLLMLVSLAFVVTYRNLKKQMKLSEIKNGLISNMSHELKTPVATVRVALEALDDYGVVNNPQQALEYVRMAKLETQRLEMLINKALNTSLLEQGILTLHREKTDIAALTTDIIKSLKLRLQQNDAQIQLHTEGSDFNLDIDKLHVQGVILNIIDNSIKYSKAPIIIDIEIIAQDASVSVNIKDNGPGIPEEYAEQVFDKFFRVPAGDTHNVQGYGLGLSYVKQVMQLHGGMVQLRRPPAGGSLFHLQFFRGR